MKFLQIFHKSRTRKDFSDIGGYEDVKDIVRRALDAVDNYNLLFTGPPASAKTLFLLGILDMRKDGVYFEVPSYPVKLAVYSIILLYVVSYHCIRKLEYGIN